MDIYRHLLNKNSSGLEFKPSSIDRKVDTDVLGAPPDDRKSFGRLQKLLNSPLKSPYQGQILSCVHCTTAFLNAYNSYFLEDNAVDALSWLFTYAQVKHYPGGTSANECLGLVCTKGQPLDVTLPSEQALHKGEQWAQTAPITAEAKREAEHFKGKEYLKVSANRAEILKVLEQTPMMFGLNVGSSNWSDPNSVVYAEDHRFGHATCGFDIVGEDNLDLLKSIGKRVNERNIGDWIAVNWWNADGWDIRVLDKNYPLFWGRVLVNAIDTKLIKKEEKKNMKLLKTADDPKIYLLDLSNRLHWICNEDSYQRFVEKNKDFSHVEVVSQEVLTSYEMGEPMNMIAMSILDTVKFYIKHKLINLD